MDSGHGIDGGLNSSAVGGLAEFQNEAEEEEEDDRFKHEGNIGDSPQVVKRVSEVCGLYGLCAASVSACLRASARR